MTRTVHWAHCGLPVSRRALAAGTAADAEVGVGQHEVLKAIAGSPLQLGVDPLEGKLDHVLGPMASTTLEGTSLDNHKEIIPHTLKEKIGVMDIVLQLYEFYL